MNRFRRALGWLAGGALAAYFVWFAYRTVNFSELREVATWPVLAALVLAALLYASIIPVTAWAWAGLLRRQGENWTTSSLSGLLGRVQLAKYVPGNIAQHAGRAFLALKAGMGARVLAVTVAQETVLAVAASVLVGMLALALSGPGIAQLPEQAANWVWGLALLSFVAVSTLAFFNLRTDQLANSPSWLARALGRVGGLPGARVVLPAVAAYSMNYVVIGVGLWLVARAAGLPPSLDIAVAIAVFALSWLLGFLAPGAPAGLGVREGIMVLLLANVVSDAEALVFVLLARAVTLAGDVIIHFASYLLVPGRGGERMEPT